MSKYTVTSGVGGESRSSSGEPGLHLVQRAPATQIYFRGRLGRRLRTIVINPCALSTSSSRGTFFARTMSTPASEASFFDRLSACKLNKMIGMFRNIFRSLDAAFKPFITGIERSRTITSGLIRLATSMACLPFSASPQVSKPLDKKAATRIFRITVVSSATSAVLPSTRLLGSPSIFTAPSPGLGSRDPPFTLAPATASVQWRKRGLTPTHGRRLLPIRETESVALDISQG
jgi:hypothetical protein